MREITKTITIPVDGRKMDFRLTKLDAFSGASLLRMLSHLPAGDDFLTFFSVLPDEDILSTNVVSFQPSDEITLSFEGTTTKGLIISRMVDADSYAGPWRTQLLVELR
jgi:hypothetical protein